jgi:hypothetical protein
MQMSKLTEYTQLDFITDTPIRTVSDPNPTAEVVAKNIYKNFYSFEKYKIIKLQYVDIYKPNHLELSLRQHSNIFICYRNYEDNIDTHFLEPNLNESGKKLVISCLNDDVAKLPLDHINPDTIILLMNLAVQLCADNTLMYLNSIEIPENHARSLEFVNIGPLLDRKKFNILDMLFKNLSIRLQISIHFFNDILVEFNDIKINWIVQKWYKNLNLNATTDLKTSDYPKQNITFVEPDIDPISYLITTASKHNSLVALENFTKIGYFYFNSLYLFIPLYYNNFIVFQWLLNYCGGSKTGIYLDFINEDSNDINDTALTYLDDWEKAPNTVFKKIIKDTKYQIHTVKTSDVIKSDIFDEDSESNNYWVNTINETERKLDIKYGKSKISDKLTLPEVKADQTQIDNTNKIGALIWTHIIYSNDIKFLVDVLNITCVTPFVWHFGIIWSCWTANLEMLHLFKNYTPDADLKPFVKYSLYSGHWSFIDTVFKEYDIGVTNEYYLNLNIDFLCNISTLHWCFYKSPNLLTPIDIKLLYIKSKKSNDLYLRKWLLTHSWIKYSPICAKVITNWSKKFSVNGIGPDLSLYIAKFLYPQFI